MSKQLISQLKDIVRTTKGEEKVKERFLKRVEEGAVTRDENPLTHFCVYFAGYDPENQQVFIGRHKKSGLWLFNGGHLREGEMLFEALEREAKQEWGENIRLDKSHTPALLTITKIDNPGKQKCKLHYDIWYFIPLNRDHFGPEDDLLQKEFYQIGWKSTEEARDLIKDINTHSALTDIEKLP